MSSKRIVHTVNVDDFLHHLKKGADLLDGLSPDEIEDIIEMCDSILFNQALKGDTTAHNTLYLLNQDQFHQVTVCLRVYDDAFATFEKACPHLVGSIPAEVTQGTVRKLFFALLGADRDTDALSFLEHMWQYFAWDKPHKKIPAYAFNTIFSLLMASERDSDALSLLEDSKKYVDWDDSGQHVTVVQAAMEIFSVLLSLGKYALAKRVITKMKPHIDYKAFLEQLEADVSEQKIPVQVEQEENQQGGKHIPDVSAVSTDTDMEDRSEFQDMPPILASATEEQVKNPSVLALVKAHETLVPLDPTKDTTTETLETEEIEEIPLSVPSGNPEFPYNIQLPVWDEENSPIGVIRELNANLHEMVLMLVKDGVKCLHDIPCPDNTLLTDTSPIIKEFQSKFPRYNDAGYVRQIKPILIKVKKALESTDTYQQKRQSVKKISRPTPTNQTEQQEKKPVDFRNRKQASFFQKRKKRRASR
ncbi:hypothetical protein HYW94_00700 [Candidatus Uhrbacteria bacterium]|nr:hypothetical protein [Candidatus Uhrbacteria bacterium]